MYRFFFLIYIYVFYIRTYSSAVRLLTTDGLDYDKLLYTDLGKLDADAVVERSIAKHRCHNQVVKLTDGTTDCTAVCADGDYVKRSTTNRDQTPGAVYCVPAGLDTCHTHTGIVVKDTGGWSCASLYPTVFGGRDADEIVACDGTLIDTANRKTYYGRIPGDLIISTNPEHETNADGSFRFTCPIKRDHMNNAYVSTDISRLHMIPNKCARALYNDSGRSRPDFNTGKCACADSYVSVGDIEPFCAPITEQTDTVQQFYEPCMNLRAPFNMHVKPCGATTINGKNMSAMYKFNVLISKVGVADRIV